MTRDSRDGDQRFAIAYWEALLRETQNHCKFETECSRCEIKKPCEKLKKLHYSIFGSPMKNWRGAIRGDFASSLLRNFIKEKPRMTCHLSSK